MARAPERVPAAGGPEGGLRHVVLSLGIPLECTEDGDSPRPGLELLEQAPEHARSVGEALRAFSYKPHVDGDEVAQLTHWGRVNEAITSQDTDVLVVHIVGHGEIADRRSEKLYVLDFAGRRFEQPVDSWITRIEDFPDEQRPHTLFILDICYAGEAAVTAWHTRMDVTKRRAWVLAATGPEDPAFGYRLSRAVVKVLDDYRTGRHRFDPSVPYIPPVAVYRDIERVVNELITQDQGCGQQILTSLIPSHADLSGLPFFPNPSFALTAVGPGSGLPPEIARLADWAWDPEHFMRRGGGAEPVGRAWDQGYFSGRVAELCDLASWLDDPAAQPRFRIVTGKPGAGKSALLGILVCAAHPLMRSHTTHLWKSLRNLAPGEHDRLVVVHARRLTLDQIVSALSLQLRHLRPSDAPSLGGANATNSADYLVGLIPQKEDDERTITIVLDALDEAERPGEIVSSLLLPLAQHTYQPESRLRLLVGTRNGNAFRPLLNLARGQKGAITDLSTADREEVRAGVFDYVQQLLAADGPYAQGVRRSARMALARAIAEELTDPEKPLEWGEFLTAGLYVHYLLTAEAPVDNPDEADALGRRVPRTLPDLLALDLSRHDQQPQLRPVLTALAYAHGRGMPEIVIAHAAAAFSPRPMMDPLPLDLVYDVLDREARFYLRRDVDADGTTLYRLFHEGLADWLRAHPRPPKHGDRAE